MGQGVTVCARWCCGRVAVQEGIEMVIGTHRCKRRSAGEHAHRRSSASWPRRACGGRGAPRARPTRRGRAYIASSRSRCPRCASPAPQVCARPRSRVPSARRVWRTVGYFPVTRPARWASEGSRIFALWPRLLLLPSMAAIMMWRVASALLWRYELNLIFLHFFFFFQNSKSPSNPEAIIHLSSTSTACCTNSFKP